MVDLAQALSEIKSLPDHALQRELKSPSGSIPGWLALGEIHERKRIRATSGGGDPNKRPSMAEEYAGNIQPILAGAGMAQPPPPPQAAMPSQGQVLPPRPQGGIAGLPPPAQAGLGSMPQAQAPQGYSDGGIVGLAGGGSIRDRIMTGLINRGLPPHIAQGFVMNFQDESGLNPGIQEHAPRGGRGGFGLYQLTGPRRVAYENYAQGRGVPLSSTDAQLDFMMGELKGSEARAAKVIYAQPDAPHAAAAIVKNFLRPAPEHLASRTSRYLSGNATAYTPTDATTAAGAGTAAASGVVAQQAADTAGKMTTAEVGGGTGGGNPMGEYFLMQQLLGAGQQQAAPAPAPTQMTPGRPVDASQFVQNPMFMQRRSHGYG